MRSFIKWLHVIQFSLLGIFAMLVVYASVPILHPLDRFYIVYGIVLLLLSASGMCLLWFRKMFAYIVIALIDLILPPAFFSFLGLILPFFFPDMHFAQCLPCAFDANLICALIIWEITMIPLAVITVISGRKKYDGQGVGERTANFSG